MDLMSMPSLVMFIVDGLLASIFCIITDCFVSVGADEPPPLTPPASVVVVVGDADTLTDTVFASASELDAAIVVVIVWLPVDAEEEAAMVQLTAALCPPGMSVGEHPEEMLKKLGDTVIVPNLAVVCPLLAMLRLIGNVEPWVTLADDGEMLADSDGGVMTLKELVVTVTGEPWPPMETEIVCALRSWFEIAVVHETTPLLLVVFVELSPDKLKPAGSAIEAWALELAPLTLTVNVFPCIIVPESAPDCVIETEAASALGRRMYAINNAKNRPFMARKPPHRTTFRTSRCLHIPAR